MRVMGRGWPCHRSACRSTSSMSCTSLQGCNAVRNKEEPAEGRVPAASARRTPRGMPAAWREDRRRKVTSRSRIQGRVPATGKRTSRRPSRRSSSQRQGERGTWALFFGPKLKGDSGQFWATTRAMARVALGLGPPLVAFNDTWTD